MLPKILMVEDMQSVHDDIAEMLAGQVVVISALSIEQATRLFAEHPDIALIVMDACVPGDWPTTIPLVKEMRKTFRGPMIAISSVRDYRRELTDAGCDHECRKYDVPNKILEILGIS